MFEAMYLLVLAWLATAPAAPVAIPDDAPQAGNAPFVLIQPIDKSSPLLSSNIQPGSFPVAVSTVAEEALDRAVKPSGCYRVPYPQQPGSRHRSLFLFGRGRSLGGKVSVFSTSIGMGVLGACFGSFGPFYGYNLWVLKESFRFMR